MGIGEPHRGCLAFTLFDLATPWLGDASTQATPCLGDASTQATPCLGAWRKQVASGDAAIEELEKEKKSLIQEMSGTFEEGFQEALSQASCENPGVNLSNCDPTHHVVDGKVVPMDLND